MEDYCYQVESVLDERRVPDLNHNGDSSYRTEYLIKWKLYRDATWETAQKLADCMPLISHYISTKYDKKRRPEQSQKQLTCQQKCMVRRATHPPKLAMIQKIQFLKIWRDQILYLVEYSDEFPAVMTSQQLRREISLEQLCLHLEPIFLEHYKS